jgi:transcriptional antiterminator NusG
MAELEKKWYVLKTVSGKESKVKEYIDLAVKTHDLSKYISQVLIPTEKYTTTVNNKRVEKERTLLSGYVLVEAALIGEIQSTLRNTPNVLGFLGNDRKSNNPVPLRKMELDRLLGASEEKSKDVTVDFHVGESVKVADGPFSGFNGIIEEVIPQREKLKVSVKIFGRTTPLELDFNQVGKE